MIRGNFVDNVGDYALNVIQKRGLKIFQQVLYVRKVHSEYKAVVVSPSSEIDVVSVIRKFSPGKYRSATSGESISIKTDTIGVSEIDAGTTVYYWNGTQFSHIVTSE